VDRHQEAKMSRYLIASLRVLAETEPCSAHRYSKIRSLQGLSIAAKSAGGSTGCDERRL